MSQNFTLDDFRRQFDQVQKLGMRDMIASMPGMAELVPEGEDPDQALGRVERMLDAMTDEERRDPDIIDADRQARIAANSGTQPHEVEQFLAQFGRVREMMRQMAKMSLWQRMKLVLGIGKLPGQAEGP